MIQNLNRVYSNNMSNDSDPESEVEVSETTEMIEMTEMTEMTEMNNVSVTSKVSTVNEQRKAEVMTERTDVVEYKTKIPYWLFNVQPKGPEVSTSLIAPSNAENNLGKVEDYMPTSTDSDSE